MSAMNNTVENAFGHRGVAYLLMPFRHWHLRSEKERTRLTAIFTDLPEVAPLVFVEGLHGPIIDNENIDLAQA